jgi:hypothetical protein
MAEVVAERDGVEGVTMPAIALRGVATSGLVPLSTALLPFAVLALLHWGTLPGVLAGDYAQYLLHAQAIVDGKTYGDIGYIFSPLRPFVGPRVQPPGFPLTLAPIVAADGVHSPLIPLVTLASAVLFLYFAFRYLSERHSPWAAAAAIAMTGVALEGGYATSSILSDLGFCALVWALILIVDREGPWGARRVAAVTVLGLAAMLYRVAGIALIPALMLWGALHRREQGIRPLIPPAIWLLLATVIAVIERASIVLPAGLRSLSIGRLEHVVYGNLRLYRIGLFEGLLYPFPVNRLNDLYHLVAPCVIAVGVFALLKQRWRSFAVVVALVYCCMLLLSPVSDSRYTWPLLPLLGLGLFLGVTRVLQLLRPAIAEVSIHRVAFAAVIAPIVLMASWQLARRPEPPSLLGRADVHDLFSFVQDSLRPRGARVLFMNPRVLTLETGVPAMSTFWAPTPERTIAELERARITHVISGDLGVHPRQQRALDSAIVQYRSRFSPVRRNTGFTIYRFDATAPSIVGPR